jgi:hypothetical protein
VDGTFGIGIAPESDVPVTGMFTELFGATVPPADVADIEVLTYVVEPGGPVTVNGNTADAFV